MIDNYQIREFACCYCCDHYAGGVCTEHGQEVEPIGFCSVFYREGAKVGPRATLMKEDKDEQPELPNT